MFVLGIESSCDETGVAIYESQQGLIAQSLYSQVKLHQAYGGVVPELASRDHVQHIIPLLNEALQQARIAKSDLNAIAYTAGPGLIGSLLVGASFAKSLAYALSIPSIAIHHLEAHLLIAKMGITALNFPFLALLVSGGHTQLIEARGLGDYHLLGETLDDAVGEAFDKTAKLMGIPYPGGPKLAELADQYDDNFRDPKIGRFPRPMLDRAGFDFSFSGLKTHALQTWQKIENNDKGRVAIAALFQEAVVETLAAKCQKALESSALKQLVVAGGVGANRALRKKLTMVAEQMNAEVFFPALEHCTDNGAMIAYAGWLYMLANQYDQDHIIDVKARWPLTKD